MITAAVGTASSSATVAGVGSAIAGAAGQAAAKGHMRAAASPIRFARPVSDWTVAALVRPDFITGRINFSPHQP